MRYSRVLASLAAMVAMLAIGGAVFVRSARPAAQGRVAAATVVQPQPAGPQRLVGAPQLQRVLRQEIQQLLVPKLRGAAPRALAVPGPPSQFAIPAPGGQTCFVGPGTCSETPCVVPVQSSVATAVPAGSAVAETVAPQVRIAPQTARQRCPRAQVGPQTLSVVGP